MSNFSINISGLPQKPLPILSDEEAGLYFCKWSYVNIYSLKNLRDIYLITDSEKDKSLKSLTEKANRILTISDKWEERKTLEYLNALVKFGLLDDNYCKKRIVFNHSQINSELNIDDKKDLADIFFNYFRFKEVSSWFINVDFNFHEKFIDLIRSDFITESKPLYFLSERNRFTDTFLTSIENNNFKYILINDVIMRFWDVYLKWGVTLNIIEKFNLSYIGYNTDINREISVCYFIRTFSPFDLIKFIEDRFETRHIWIPELIFRIAEKYRYSVNEIKQFIISEIQNNDRLTYERTSEIFLIKGKTKKKNIDMATYLFPEINNCYVSNLILRK